MWQEIMFLFDNNKPLFYLKTECTTNCELNVYLYKSALFKNMHIKATNK